MTTTLLWQPGGGFGPFRIGVPASQIRDAVSGNWEVRQLRTPPVAMRSVMVEHSVWLDHFLTLYTGETGLTTLVTFQRQSLSLKYQSYDLWSPTTIRELHEAGYLVVTQEDDYEYYFQIDELNIGWGFNDEGELKGVGCTSKKWDECELARGVSYRPVNSNDWKFILGQ